MNKTTLAVIALAMLYFGLFPVASNGFGYAGYGGYHHGPSFWYWGGPRYYPGSSVRAGSLTGPGARGGGIHAGK